MLLCGASGKPGEIWPNVSPKYSLEACQELSALFGKAGTGAPLGSRNYDLFATREEWIETIERVAQDRIVYGIASFYPRRYEFLKLPSPEGYLQMLEAIQLSIRFDKLDPNRTVDSYEGSTTVDGFVHVIMPKLFSDFVTPGNIGIRPEDTEFGIESPVALFEALKRSFRKLSRRPLVALRMNKIVNRGYSAGALALYDSGMEFRYGLEGAPLTPAERVPGFDPAKIRIGK